MMIDVHECIGFHIVVGDPAPVFAGCVLRKLPCHSRWGLLLKKTLFPTLQSLTQRNQVRQSMVYIPFRLDEPFLLVSTLLNIAFQLKGPLDRLVAVAISACMLALILSVKTRRYIKTLIPTK